MRKTLLLVLFSLLSPLVSVASALAAADVAGSPKDPAPKAGRMPMAGMNPELKQAMMSNPKHLLAMAYHRNLVSFGMALEKVARQGETVPRDFARAAITEMRRSADQMEIYHEEAARSLPPDQQARHAEMAKIMGRHLEQMRSQLAQLETLAKADRISSRELLPHLDALFQGCREMCRNAGMCREGMGRGMYGGGPGRRWPRGGMDGGCRDCGHWQGGGPGREGCRDMMQQRQKMMEEMSAQDAEIVRLVDQMNSAPKDQKQAIMADILTRMVRQRQAMAAHLEQMQAHLRQHHMRGTPPCFMQGAYDDEDADAEEPGADAPHGMDDDDMGSDDNDSDDDSMDMRDMHMQH